VRATNVAGGAVATTRRDGMGGATEILLPGNPAVAAAVVELPGQAWRTASSDPIMLVREHPDLPPDPDADGVRTIHRSLGVTP
jgi:hypothetical protein